MNIRNYNKYFHLHTISGIIITVVLYVFFFAGSFAFFKNEINNWQNDTPKGDFSTNTIDYNIIIDSIDQNYGAYSRNLSFRLNERTRSIGLNISVAQDTLSNPKAKERTFGVFDSVTKETKSYSEGYGLGEFLYRLHFLAPVNGIFNIDIGFPIGYLIAGLVSFAFLFALITGVLIHWEKIVSNFYIFRPWEKFKTVWTDLHTALGVISFPFQFVFAVTGAYFLLNYYLVTNAVVAIGYGGNNEKFQEDIGSFRTAKQEVEFKNIPLQQKVNINEYAEKTLARWENGIITSTSIQHYGDESMSITFSGKVSNNKRLTSRGEITYFPATGEFVEPHDPNVSPGYSYIFADLVYLLHFGSFGGYATRIVYFMVGIVGCVVIISGVLIWLVARDKKNVPERKRKFNFWLANIYMAICLSKYPVTALAFIAVKLNPSGGQPFIYSFYFYTWLAISILLTVRKSIYKTNRDCLLFGSLIGFIVPITNGIVTGNWIWVSWKNHYYDILLIDLFWIIVPIITLIAWKFIRNKHEQKQMTN
ncbi:PepSY-associated TM helix domain-containing protein [Myroides injenensis]|uniref:PepSY-associated TM helix domain-containing protein n=1 Tax=Myroides injenensis TaxID=1183151 RepID=UPI0002896E2E|nr:PepSY-associated TM helix domain-containing protein [Myroides injenensis]